VDQTCLKLSNETGKSLNVSSPSHNKRSPSPASRGPSNASQKFATQPRTGPAGPDFLKDFHKNVKDIAEGCVVVLFFVVVNLNLNHVCIVNFRRMSFEDMMGKMRSDLKLPSDFAPKPQQGFNLQTIYKF